MKHIASRDNATFKALKKLCLSGRGRSKADRIVLDGTHLLESYLARFGPPETVVVSAQGAQNAEIVRLVGRLSVLLLADPLFKELTEVDSPSGVLAVAPRPECAEEPQTDVDTVLLDGVQDPGNLGSILRSAAGAGFRQALLSADCAHAWSPKTLRAAMGAHFLLDIFENADLPAFLKRYRGMSLVTALGAERPLYAVKLDAPVAWVFGSEGQGVRPDVVECAGQRVSIPMPGGTESLNVGAAAAVCLFETARQRRR